MNLSTQDRKIINNFSKINLNLEFKKDLRTIDNNRCVIAEYTLDSNEFKPFVLVRVMVGAKKPIDAGLQHTQDYSNEIKSMLKYIDVVKLKNQNNIFSEYKKAFIKKKSTVFVEYSEKFY